MAALAAPVALWGCADDPAPGGAAPSVPAVSVASESPTVVPGTVADPSPATSASSSAPSVPGTQDSGDTEEGSSGAPSTTDVAARLRLGLQAARDRWRVAGIRSYEYEYTARCDCGGPEVMVRVLGGRPIVPLMTAAYDGHGVEEWFAAIDDAIEQERLVDATYDDRAGYPLDVVMEPDDDLTDGFTPYGIESARLRAVGDPVARWFTESWGCGRRLVAATPDQTAAVVFEFDDTLPGGYAAGTRDVTRLESAELWFGSDLFAGWCREVVGTTDPTPQLLETWPIGRGTIDLHASATASEATAHATGLVATDLDGKAVALGDADLASDHWGELPG